MIPDVGTTAAFTFVAKFATLNGVYRIRAETTFKDANVSGVDFINNLYIPAGLQQADFSTDYAGYAKDRVAVLESVLDSTVVYYTPESIFLTIPDPTIKEYFPLTLVVSLGIQQNTQIVFPLLDQIKDLIQSCLGTTDVLRVVSNPENKAYLTDAEYNLLVEAREANIKKLMPLGVQIKLLQDQITALAAKCAAYEDLIIKTSTG